MTTTHTMHVMPFGDLMPHDNTLDCVCGPTTEPLPLADGSHSWLITHHSLDNREANERKSNLTSKK